MAKTTGGVNFTSLLDKTPVFPYNPRTVLQASRLHNSTQTKGGKLMKQPRRKPRPLLTLGIVLACLLLMGYIILLTAKEAHPCTTVTIRLVSATP